MSHFNQLTSAQAERLAMLAEECAEVIQVIGKIQRHGYNSYHPDDNANTNRDLLQGEFGDVLAVMEMMLRANDILADPWQEEQAKIQGKIEKKLRYTHHQ